MKDGRKVQFLERGLGDSCNTVTVIVKEGMFSQMVKGSTVIYLAPNFGDLKTILGHHSKAVLNWTRLPSKICLHYYK